ncbi:hypothetical protein ABJI51_38210 [Amycolatopsis sp. NEAU-NG30]|uniref:RiboL-PSP-HEPN domain-containing protein n=1 Tax=Amycolatopsis melonis TaxID=3156488 RepID=A0ABV0LRL0_9PSEU
MSVASPARQNFIERIESVRDAVQQPWLIDGPLGDAVHNRRAGLLRNSLMVVAFTSLEDFLRNRTSELLNHISRTVVGFSQLPNKLRTSATIGAVRSGLFQATLASKTGSDPIALIQGVAESVASTMKGALQLSPYSLGYTGSNVTVDEVYSILAALNINDPWTEMSDFAARCGFGSLPLKQAYETLQINRNTAAHDVRASIQPNDLTSFSNEALAIAMSFDLVASRAARLLNEGNSALLTAKNKLQSSIAIRFIDESAGKYREKPEKASRAVKVSSDVEEAWRLAIGRSTSTHEAVVLRGSKGLPVDWYSCDVA